MQKVFIVMIFLFFFSPDVLAASPEWNQPVRGIYVKAGNTQGPKFNQLLGLVTQTDLNAMVIDIKDDYGNLTFLPSGNSPYKDVGRPYIKDPGSLIRTLEKQNIYPIARVVVFKDNIAAAANPSWSYKTVHGEVWKNAGGAAFTNPFVREVWDYNIGIAIEAVKIGFKEIQFDYVRFPEKFESIENRLVYKGQKEGGRRAAAVTEFVKYARDKLKPYGVKVSVDVFGNATVIPEASGIGQNFSEIAHHVDVICAMIYPSHWTSYFNIQKPDLEPYRLVSEYAKVENSRLQKLTAPPVSRPWLQDFTASWLGKGNYKVYGKQEIEDQIRGLHSQGIKEFLIWNAENNYTMGVDYTPY